MKKWAVIVDFVLNNKKNLTSELFDVYIVDRFSGVIASVETHKDNLLIELFTQEETIHDFYQKLSTQYEKILFLFLSDNYFDIDDYLLTEKINKIRNPNSAQVFTYLINYRNQDKDKVVSTVLEMIDKDQSIKMILTEIHKIQERDTFSLYYLVMNYRNILKKRIY